MPYDAVDLFAGPGGWDLAARDLGLNVVGIELDANACATRAAAGLPTIRADVAALPPDRFAGVVGLIASPPCPDFSKGGRRAGLNGETGALVWQVRRWATALRPRWVACEQVPEVLPIWRLLAAELGEAGYSTWAGVLDAAAYGVPQHRERAILVASLDRSATPPPPTHGPDAGPSLFGEVAPYVVMADALGWPPGGPAAGWVLNTGRAWKKGGTRDDAQSITLDRPAPTVATIATQWAWRRPARTITGTVGGVGGAVDAAGQTHINLTIEEATILQGFPPGYPWAGRTAKERWQQVGNAIPPPLAARILAAVAC